MNAGETLGPVGAWRLRFGLTTDLASSLEEWGYSGLWIGGSPAADLNDPASVLAGTRALLVATAVVNIWDSPAGQVAGAYRRLLANYPGRFLLGIGSGHRENVGASFQRPLHHLREYLNELDACGLSASGRVLAALGPASLSLAAERAAGAHTYFAPPEHTAAARRRLGPDALLVVEQKVILDADHGRARRLARASVSKILAYDNYLRHLRRLGFTDGEISSGADRLLDALVAHGSTARVRACVVEHLEAGADHVAINVLGPATVDPRPQFERIARALSLTPITPSPCSGAALRADEASLDRAEAERPGSTP